ADLAAAEFMSAGRDAPQVVFDGTTKAVVFVRTTLAPHARAGLEFVRIAETNTEFGPALVRMRAPYMPSTGWGNDRDQPDFADPVVLVRGPYRLTFSYAGPDRVWRETWQRSIELPTAIRLTVRDMATERILTASTTTLVHAAVAPECVVTKSRADCLALRERQAQ